MFIKFIETLVLTCFLLVFISLILYGISNLYVLCIFAVVIFIFSKLWSRIDKELLASSNPEWIRKIYIRLRILIERGIKWISCKDRVSTMKLILMLGRGLFAVMFGFFVFYQAYEEKSLILSLLFLITGTFLIVMGGYFIVNFQEDID